MGDVFLHFEVLAEIAIEDVAEMYLLVLSYRISHHTSGKVVGVQDAGDFFFAHVGSMIPLDNDDRGRL
jgi:hypothetical protein